MASRLECHPGDLIQVMVQFFSWAEFKTKIKLTWFPRLNQSGQQENFWEVKKIGAIVTTSPMECYVVYGNVRPAMIYLN